MGLLPIPAPRLTQGASRAGFWRAAALYDKRLPPPSFRLPHVRPVHARVYCTTRWRYQMPRHVLASHTWRRRRGGIKMRDRTDLNTRLAHTSSGVSVLPHLAHFKQPLCQSFPRLLTLSPKYSSLPQAGHFGIEK